ncbi:M56 family metallopeptidase [Flavobacterium wongokense]|uniref:M56 family metallopeptidase n=1 Tax=Flavobacterium wongokense TaxID=2910674 RepID=UPI001F22D390|nr:M56 family metallopeptidase [Flavobacterium sp. WG47]MCF6132234.1 M56 family metallopeptidase [Flavobacterium sp. WG47]
MDQLFLYLLKSGGLIAVFYLAYHFLVRKETFFNSNRWFLLSGLATSLLLPLFFISKIVIVERPVIQVQDYAVVPQQPAPIIHNIPVAEPFDWTQLLWTVYFIIAAVLVIKIVINLASLYRMLTKQQSIKKEQFKLINLNDNIAPFSFFNYIVYNPNLYSEKELENILLHEKIHSKGKHSIDVLTAETMCALFWFNPFMWLYKKAITQNLEYIADQRAIEQTDDRKSYQHALLKVVSNQNCLPITNNFYQSLIKKRIVMLNKNQSHRRSYLKYAMILPALVGFVLLFQVKVIAQDKFIALTNDVALASSNTVTNQDSVTEEALAIPIPTEGEGNYVFDKTETDENLKDDAADIEQVHKISFTISNVKRNSNGEIISIKMAFDDKKGNKGKVEQDRTIPIRPIFFQVKQKDGKSIIGFYDNPDMVVKPVDPVNENKIVTIESIKDNALIYVDGERYTKESLSELDPKGLEKIELLKDAASLAQYGAKDRSEVVVITTNWPSREQNIAMRQQQSPNIITLQNGDEVVIFDKCNMKIPGYPSVQFTDSSPVMILNGVQQKNPRLILESMPLSKIKTIKVLDANDKETKGTPIYKLILTTK